MNDTSVQPASPQTAPATPAPGRLKIIASDRPRSRTRLEESGAALLAEAATHTEAETPFTIGLLGGPGAGKSSLLEALLARIAAIGQAASSLAGKSPFVARLAIARFDALSGAADPAAGLAAAVDLALRQPGSAGLSYAAFAEEAAQSLDDPQEAAREAEERADAARRRYEAETEATEASRARLARLQDVILYETPGSRIDAYARANRGKLEQRLTGFGFKEADPVNAYKNLVGDVAESAGRFAGLSVFLRSLWAFRGQARLIVLAVLFLLVGLALGYIEAAQPQWTAWLQGQGERMAPTADWLARNAGILATLATVSYAIAALCLVVNVIRALRFGRPVLHGVNLLRADAAARRGELETQLALRARRVEALKSEWEKLRRRAEEAGRRAEGAAGQPPARAAFWRDDRTAAARAFLESIDRLMANGEGPARIVVAVDGLDALPAPEAVKIMETVHRLLDRPAYVTLLALDPHSLGEALGHDRAARARRLEKLVQLPFAVSGPAHDPAALLGTLLAPATPQSAVIDAARSAIEPQLSAQETELLVRLAPLAGETPRQLKRFVNAWRLARLMAGDNGAATALMLAAELGDEKPVLSMIGDAVNDPDAMEASGPVGLAQAARAARAAAGRPITSAELIAARRIARRFAMPEGEGEGSRPEDAHRS